MLDIETVRNEYRTWEEVRARVKRLEEALLEIAGHDVSACGVTQCAEASRIARAALDGLRLLAAIRAWGDALVALKESERREREFAAAIRPDTRGGAI